MMFRIGSAHLVLTAGVTLCAFAAAAAWEPGEPVVTYWGGPGWMCNSPVCPPLDETWVRQLKEGGFNTAWASAPADLDLLAKYGMRAIYRPAALCGRRDLNDPAKVAAMAEAVAAAKGHPALYVYSLADEPPATAFQEVSRLVEWLRRQDPDHAAWVNLLPTYANHQQLGVGGKEGEAKRFGFANDVIASYWEHVRLFGEIVRPAFLSYDHYQFRTSGDTSNYFLNLGIIRQSASARRLPFWNGVQACTWTPGKLASPRSPRIPGPGEMRFLVYSTVAYGAQGIYYYCYARKGHDGTIVALDGTPDAKYEALKEANRAFVAISKELAPLDFTGAYFQGLHAPGTTPYCGQALLRIAPETPYAELKPLQELTDTTLVTRFDAPGKPTHLMVVNCDYRKARTLFITAPPTTERFDPLTRTWSLVGGAFDLALPDGGGVLLRLGR